MLIISSRDNENNRWKRKVTKNKDRKEQRGDTNCSESVRAKGFCCAFKLGFLQLICIACLIFKWNSELPLSIILKERELYESKYVWWSVDVSEYETCYPFWYVPQSYF